MAAIRIRSLKVNFLLNNTRILLNLLVPLLVFPYISRILGPSGLGKVEFANSIVSYFVLFTSLGIPVYGVRVIARNRDNSNEYSRIVQELTIISIITCIIGYIIYFIIVGFFSAFSQDFLLFLIIAPTIFLSDFSYEWFYIGIEDQLYITIRSVFVKFVQVILIFVLIHSQDDLLIYASILIGLSGFSTLFNIINLRKYVSFTSCEKLNLVRHVKPIFVIFASVLAINIYMHLDVTMVGLYKGNKAVGLYTAANKLVRLVLAIVTSISSVMIPRLENSIAHNNSDDYYRHLTSSINILMLLAIPSFFGIIVLAPQIIDLFAGFQYSEAVLSIRLLSPIIIIVSLANFVGLQILYSQRKEIYYTISVSIAALANFGCNLFLIPKYSQNGAIIGTLIAEITGLIIQILYAKDILKEIKIRNSNFLFLILLASLVMFCVLLVCNYFLLISNLFVCILLGLFIYFTIIFLFGKQYFI